MKLIKIGKLERVYEFKKKIRKGLLIRKRKKNTKAWYQWEYSFSNIRIYRSNIWNPSWLVSCIISKMTLSLTTFERWDKFRIINHVLLKRKYHRPLCLQKHLNKIDLMLVWKLKFVEKVWQRCQTISINTFTCIMLKFCSYYRFWKTPGINLSLNIFYFLVH